MSNGNNKEETNYQGLNPAAVDKMAKEWGLSPGDMAKKLVAAQTVATIARKSERVPSHISKVCWD